MSTPRAFAPDDEFLRGLLRRLDARACLPRPLLEQLAAGAPPIPELTGVHAHLKGCLHCLNAFARLQFSLCENAESGVRFVGESPSVRVLQVRLGLVAEMDDGRGAPPVLVTGEIGTGKALVARMIHALSRRASRAFVEVGCPQTPASRLQHELFGGDPPAADAAIAASGLFAAADGGTLFLDGVHALSLGLQGQLLTAIAERSVGRPGGVAASLPDVRVIVATHVDLDDAARRGMFRADLLDRLMVSTVSVPPLRERPDDIVPLARYLAGRFSGHSGRTLHLTPEAEARLLRYGWPGNIGELNRVIARAALGHERDAIGADELDLPVS